MKYPLSDTEQYSGKIIFTPYAEEYIDVTKTASQSLQDLSNLTRYANDAVSGTSTDDARASRKYDSGSRRKSVTVPKTTNGAAAGGPITLYLPQGIAVSDQVSYERLDLGAIGAIGAAALGSGSSPLQAVKQAGMQAGRSMMDFIGDRKNMSSELAALAAVRLSPGNVVGGAARSQLGVAVNPNTKSLFRSVELRTFGFTFKLIASSEAEAIEIEKIVKAFRTELYPETINVPDAFNAPIGYKFPNKFRIILQYNGIRLPIKFLDANLISVQTSYNPSSMGWHANGKPSEVDFTLQFGEPKTLSKQDIEAGY